MQHVTLYGSQQLAYGELAHRSLGAAHGFLSIGSDPNSPSLANKGVPNEDALLIACHEERWLFAVCDGHFGTAGLDLIHALVERIGIAFPRRLADLSLLLLEPFSSTFPRSGTTLTLALVDGAAVCGFCFGDSLIISADAQECRARCVPNEAYLLAGRPAPLEEIQPFRFELAPGEALLLCSDGVNECCYRQPSQSLALSDLHALRMGVEGNPALWGEAVTRAALQGKNGAPGGQDNIAVITFSP